MSNRSKYDAIIVFFVAFFLRLVSVVITTTTSLNTYSQADANGFAAHAAWIATTVTNGSSPSLNFNDIYHVWGAMLSPFWFIPGPSRIYARVGIALLGALAIYNVYVVVRYHHSMYAGVLAVLPMIFYPSFLFLHAAILREAMVLFALTSATRFLLAPSLRLKKITAYTLAVFFITIATILRDDNLPVYLLVFAIAAFLVFKPWQRYEKLTAVTIGIGIVTVPIVVFVYGRRILDYLIFLRQARAQGRTAYLESILPGTITQAIAFSWIGAMYFLFTPFPWMITQTMDLVIMWEGIINLVYAIAAVSGARILAKKTLAGTTALVVGIAVGAVLYGLGTVNVGTAVRHRQMVLWAIFLLGGIGIAHYINVRMNSPHYS